MWSQFKETSFTVASSNSINVSSVTNINEGDWVILNPFNKFCEIRKVISILGTTLTLNINLVNSGSYTNYNLFVHTSPNWDILLFGADSILATSAQNTESINKAIQDCLLNEGGIVSIPKGNYLIEPISGSSYCINISRCENIKFIGEGMGVSILTLDALDESGNGVIFYGNPCSGIEWHHLTLEGNKSSISAGTDSHIIQLEALDESLLVTNIIIENIEFLNAGGKGVYVNSIDRLTINQSNFQYCESSSIHVTGFSQNTWVNNSYFKDNSSHDISYRLENYDANYGNNIITNNNFFNSVAMNIHSIMLLNGGNSMHPEKFIIADNIIENRGVYVMLTSFLEFTNNLVVGGNLIPFEGVGTIENLVFENNVINNNATQSIAVSFKNEEVNLISNINFANNTIQGGECYFENCVDLSFINNKVYQTDLINNVGLRIVITAMGTDTTLGNLTIANNQFLGITGSGIELSNGPVLNRYNLILIDTNLIYGTSFNYGIRVTNTYDITPYWDKLIIGTSNLITDTHISPISVFTSYMMEQNPYQETWISNGNPDGYIIAPQGSYAIDKTIEADNKYQKCALNNSYTANTGWQLLSEMYLQLLIKDVFDGAAQNLDSSGHTPTSNVYFTKWQAVTGLWKTTGPSIMTAVPYTLVSGKAVALFNSTKADAEIKAVFSYNSSGSTYPPAIPEAGIIFRSDNAASNYWKFVFRKTGTGFEIALALVGTGAYSETPITVYLGPSNRFVLKVIVQGDYISAYYNDLQMYSIKKTNNNTQMNHGLIALNTYYSATTSTSFFSCDNFKLLIP